MAWDDAVLRAEVFGEFRACLSWSEHDHDRIVDMAHARRKADQSEAARDYYRFKVRPIPERAERHRRLARARMRKSRALRRCECRGLQLHFDFWSVP